MDYFDEYANVREDYLSMCIRMLQRRNIFVAEKSCGPYVQLWPIEKESPLDANS